jgi:hypothetical protein
VAGDSDKCWPVANGLKKLSISIKRGNLLDYLRSYKLHKRYSSSMALVSQSVSQPVSQSASQSANQSVS